MKTVSLLLAATLGGCASLPPSEIAESHPANPNATSSAYPILKPTLMNATNSIATEAEPPASNHQHKHP